LVRMSSRRTGAAPQAPELIRPRVSGMGRGVSAVHDVLLLFGNGLGPGVAEVEVIDDFPAPVDAHPVVVRVNGPESITRRLASQIRALTGRGTDCHPRLEVAAVLALRGRVPGLLPTRGCHQTRRMREKPVDRV